MMLLMFEAKHIVKPSGFKCKKIVFDNLPTAAAQIIQVPSKNQNDLASELERRKKQQLDLVPTVSNPLDAPLTAPRIPKPKIIYCRR
ncbi:unnamed protein product [Rhizophagus irregularis]|nr:unnamed protein product [Rhizophagus irregularis]